MLIFYADKFMVMGNSKNSHEFNFVILITNCENLMLAKYTCFTIISPGSPLVSIHVTFGSTPIVGSQAIEFTRFL